MLTFGLCLHSVYAYILSMLSFGLCLHSVYAYIRSMLTFGLCLHSVYAYIRPLQVLISLPNLQPVLIDCLIHNLLDSFAKLINLCGYTR